ncbi:MAG TPA: O-antigen polysaccharide polymerase Wzy [bacterium]|jgi:hypothetical protein|nr:O-antigen polysaccharide polymerase Wzy [bacterium]
MSSATLMGDTPLLQVPADTRYFRRIGFGLIAAWVLVLLAVLFVSNWCTEKNLLAALVLSLGLSPMAAWFLEGQGGDFPIFQLHTLYYGMNYGLASLYANPQLTAVSESDRVVALQATAMGLGVMLWAYYFIGVRLFRRIRPLKVTTPVPYENFLRWAWVIAFISAIKKITGVDFGPLEMLVYQPLLYLGWMANTFILVDLLVYKRGKKLRSMFFFGLLMFFQFFSAIGSGLFSNILILVFFMIFVYLNVKKRVLMKVIVLSVVFFVILEPLKNEFRLLTWGPKNTSVSAVQRASIFAELLVSKYSAYSSVASTSVNQVVSRIDDAYTLARVMQQTPDYVPYSNGSTYLSLLTIWIPRAIWPDKPQGNIGNTWAHWYGLLDQDDFTTSYNLPWIVEFYINFGWAGIIVGMFLSGILFAWLAAFFCFPGASALEYSAAVPLLLNLWYAESNFALVAGGLIIGLVVLRVYMKAMPYLAFKF